MKTESVLVASLLALAACGGATPPPDDSDDAIGSSDVASSSGSDVIENEPGDGEDEAAPPPEVPEEPQGDTESALEELARYLIKRPGRRVAYSAQQERFAVTRETTSGGLFTIDISFVDESGREQKAIRICDPNECDEQLNDLAKKKIPELADQFDTEGYKSVRAIGWPTRNELKVSTLAMKLKLDKRRLTGTTEDGKKVTLGTLPHKAPYLHAIFPIPDEGLVGYYASADESGVNKVFGVFKIKGR